MKEFSLEEYLKNPNRKIVTRDWRNVRIICTDRQGEGRPILALCFVFLSVRKRSKKTYREELWLCRHN